MTQERFILGVDLDGVCADFYGGLREVAAEWLDRPISELATEVSFGLREWGIDQVGSYDDLHRFAVTQRDLFSRLKPIDGAPVTLRRLSAMDIRIRIITHRLCIKYFHQETVRQTVQWLDDYGIPYWDLCFLKDKGAVGADLYVEDSPENVKRLRSQGYPTIVFTNSTNRELPGPRADCWTEVETLVRKSLDEWKNRARG
jgi:5'(3')-deoxyribonucleotidase